MHNRDRTNYLVNPRVLGRIQEAASDVLASSAHTGQHPTGRFPILVLGTCAAQLARRGKSEAFAHTTTSGCLTLCVKLRPSFPEPTRLVGAPLCRRDEIGRYCLLEGPSYVPAGGFARAVSALLSWCVKRLGAEWQRDS